MTTLFSIWTAVAVVSVVIIWRTLVLGGRVAEALRLADWDRNMARRVLYRGVVNAPEGAEPVIRRYRCEVLLGYGALIALAMWALGSSVIFLIGFIALTAIFSKPLDAAKGGE